MIQDGVQLEILFLCDRIVFVCVTLGTIDRCAHPDLHGGVHAIHNRNTSEFFVVRATFAVGHGVAMECGGLSLRISGTRQHVTSDLFDGELVVRHVGIDRPDDPVAIRPDGARGIVGVAGRVGIACQI